MADSEKPNINSNYHNLKLNRLSQNHFPTKHLNSINLKRQPDKKSVIYACNAD